MIDSSWTEDYGITVSSDTSAHRGKGRVAAVSVAIIAATISHM